MIVLDNSEPNGPIIDFHGSLNKIRKEEFEALYRIINGIGVELRLLVSIAGQDGTGEIDSQRVLDIANRYENESLEVIRKITLKLRGIV